MFLKCSRCGYTWHYQGKGRDRTTCPQCFKTVYFSTGKVDADTYRKNAILQVEKWYNAEKKVINDAADYELNGHRPDAEPEENRINA